MKIFIAGAGTMGMGIAQVFAQAGHEVSLFDIKPEFIDRGLEFLEKTLARQIEVKRMEPSVKDTILSRITKEADLNKAAECGFVIEAIAENAHAKRMLFAALDKVCGPDVIFASNTSSISITELASAVSRTGKVIGMHFFNPAAIMNLVEVVRGYHTSDETFAYIFSLAKELGKEPVEVDESPGFVVNRILIPMINEAIGVLETGVSSATDIDKAMRLGAGHPMGPLSLADMIGNDVVLSIMDTLLRETGDTKYRASGLLRMMVRAGKLGRKTGAGFFEYNA